MHDEDRGLTIEVTDHDGTPLKEYHTQKLGSAQSRSENVVSTTNIEAIDDLSFVVKITPHHPFPILAVKDPKKKKTTALADCGRISSLPMALGREPYNFRPTTRFDPNTNIEQEVGNTAMTNTATGSDEILDDEAALFLSPAKLPNTYANIRGSPGEATGTIEFKGKGQGRTIKATNKPALPPFDLLATVFIDGNPIPETRKVIYLSRTNPRYKQSYVLRGRWVDSPGNIDSSSNAKFTLMNWVFTPVGIDHHLAQLSLTETEPEVDELIDQFRKTTTSTSPKNPTPKDGTIEVRISRVIPGEKITCPAFQPYHRASATGAVTASDSLAADATHTTTLSPAKDSQSVHLLSTTTTWYSVKEMTYAKFIFHYKARAKLIRMGIANADGSSVAKEGLMLGGYRTEALKRSWERRGAVAGPEAEGDANEAAGRVAAAAETDRTKKQKRDETEEEKEEERGL